MNPIVSVARREALLSVLLALLYLAGWAATAYLVPPGLTLAGWPLWFVLSCLFNPLLFVLLCALMVRVCFRPVALGDHHES
ncbi:hypothetical protein CGX12_03995 [Zobellella denitrificans]|jgi:uncharacterized membrane protein YhdT|uniref:Uncharacterized protein n=1 Tax=Zobellella denitrificans TaxID=347534 RepID=A0A231N1R3_9GAMM|nr:DUF997 family protein [Zobellella denitrificans]ATG73128.1 hypothetical protein AN401_04060 [Zobellella denitrificans]OXS16434.1 hypothetical protein CGX12_03995 [Zobellella denitrificans]